MVATRPRCVVAKGVDWTAVFPWDVSAQAPDNSMALFGALTGTGQCCSKMTKAVTESFQGSPPGPFAQQLAQCVTLNARYRYMTSQTSQIVEIPRHLLEMGPTVAALKAAAAVHKVGLALCRFGRCW